LCAITVSDQNAKFVLAKRSIPLNTTPANNLILRAQKIARGYGKIWDERLGRIISFWVGPPPAFPARGRKKILAINELNDEYLRYYINRYYNDREGAIVMQPVSTLPDPVVDEVLKAYKNVAAGDLPRISREHRLSMQAENIVGKLLERYVSGLLESKGWVWCAGETLRSVDFMRDEDTTEPKFLQIKNRSNSENSSSAAIRAGTTIKKWYRISSTTSRTRWDCLPENDEGICTEQGFYQFVHEEAKRQRPVEIVPLEEVVEEELDSECN
jgi:hypothetical protein